MTRTARKSLAALVAAFGTTEFAVNFSTGLAYSATAQVDISGRIAQQLIGAGSLVWNATSMRYTVAA